MEEGGEKRHSEDQGRARDLGKGHFWKTADLRYNRRTSGRGGQTLEAACSDKAKRYFMFRRVRLGEKNQLLDAGRIFISPCRLNSDSDRPTVWPTVLGK